jgi:glyoxylase-like metal-dependent hydrolase (beta-lactamase superfamily II)
MQRQQYGSNITEIEGIYRIKIRVPFAVKSVAVYVIPIDNFYILYDAGFNSKEWQNTFFAALDELEINPKDITHCFISHEHVDHMGIVLTLKQLNPELKVIMHDITNDTLNWENSPSFMEDLEKNNLKFAQNFHKYGISTPQLKNLVKWIKKWPKFRPQIPVDITLEDDEEIIIGSRKFKAIWTPGHSLGHMCLFDMEKQILFAGDHILSAITPHIGNYSVNPYTKKKYPTEQFSNVLLLYLQSLDRIDHLHPNIILPAHQDIIYHPKDRIEMIRSHHQNRLDEISNLIKNNPLTPMEISLIHFDKELDDMNRMLAVSEILGHLIYLEEKGLVSRVDAGETVKFVKKN